MLINEIVVASDDEEIQSFREDVKSTISTIISTPVGSVPLFREFGINQDMISSPSDVAKEMISQEIIEKVEKYEPRAVVEAVEINSNSDGTNSVFISVSQNDDEIEEDDDDTLDTEEDEYYYDDEDYDADEEYEEDADE